MKADRLRLRLMRAFEVAQEERWASDLSPTPLKDVDPENLMLTAFHHGCQMGLVLALTILNEEDEGEDE